MKRTALFVIVCLLAFCDAFAQEVSDHMFVVIINGGKNKLMNHERYWNDCAFLYQTLRHDYQIPKRNFTLLMSDGGNPASDMLREDANSFVSSPTDLDGDGERDVWTSATLANVTDALTTLSARLTPVDHLFLFLMSHGGTNDGQTASYAWLWQGEKLEDATLAALLSRFQVRTMNIVMGQCYSGGFIDNVATAGRVIATACRGDELSWRCHSKPYDSFLYHWTCAVAGHDEQGSYIDADTDDDGRVSMAEAFDYARSHDEREETPQFCALPESLGRTWSFDGSTLGISERLTDAPPAEVYSLQGVRMLNPRRGLYIRRGRKMIKKP